MEINKCNINGKKPITWPDGPISSGKHRLELKTGDPNAQTVPKNILFFVQQYQSISFRLF